MSRPDGLAIVRTALDIAAEYPAPPDGWPAAWPTREILVQVKRCGWPLRSEVVAIPTRGHVGKLAQQPATVVPTAWLRELARRLGVPLRAVCRGTVGPQ